MQDQWDSRIIIKQLVETDRIINEFDIIKMVVTIIIDKYILRVNYMNTCSGLIQLINILWYFIVDK